jgi:hypothetical protein
MLRTIGAIPAFLMLVQCAASAAEVIEADICIYGGTSGGVIAAVQAARQGKRAAIAIDDGVAVQNVDQSKLRQRLLADNQVLEWK